VLATYFIRTGLTGETVHLPVMAEYYIRSMIAVNDLVLW
jgi:hypothetical protein